MTVEQMYAAVQSEGAATGRRRFSKLGQPMASPDSRGVHAPLLVSPAWGMILVSPPCLRPDLRVTWYPYYQTHMPP